MSSPTILRFLVGPIVIALLAGVYIAMRPAVKSDVSSSAAESAEESSLLASDVAPAASVEGGDVVEDVPVLREEVAFLRKELATLTRHIGEMRARLDSLSAPAAEAQQEDNDWTAFGEELNEGNLKAQEEAAAARDYSQSLMRMQTYEANLQTEPADAAWSPQAKYSIDKAFATQELSATIVEDIECRSTLCRLTVSHANAEERRQFEQTFVGNVAEVLPRASMHSEEHEDGSSTSTVYLARDGHRFPHVEASYEW